MKVPFIKKGKESKIVKRTVSIVLGFIILIILIYLPSIIAQMKKYSFDHDKQWTIETKVISYKEFREMYYQQMKLAQKLEGTIKYSLIAKEVRKGYDAVTYDVFF
jgi:quinol-cytochrome oxidoreductase complex cytochrome b subunit